MEASSSQKDRDDSIYYTILNYLRFDDLQTMRSVSKQTKKCADNLLNGFIGDVVIPRDVDDGRLEVISDLFPYIEGITFKFTEKEKCFNLKTFHEMKQIFHSNLITCNEKLQCLRHIIVHLDNYEVSDMYLIAKYLPNIKSLELYEYSEYVAYTHAEAVPKENVTMNFTLNYNHLKKLLSGLPCLEEVGFYELKIDSRCFDELPITVRTIKWKCRHIGVDVFRGRPFLPNNELRYNLRTLSLCYDANDWEIYSDFCQPLLRNFANLRELCLNFPFIIKVQFDSINLPQLQSLTLIVWSFGDNFQLSQPLMTLTYLSITCTAITETEFINLLQNFPNLESVNFCFHTNYTQSVIDTLSSLTALRSFRCVNLDNKENRRGWFNMLVILINSLSHVKKFSFVWSTRDPRNPRCFNAYMKRRLAEITNSRRNHLFNFEFLNN